MGYTTLKAALDAVVKTNGRQQITGSNLNGVMTTLLKGVDILDRANPADTSGMNKVVLDKSSGFSAQVADANTIYEIRDSFNLGGGSVSIPSGCVLYFNGGKLTNGTLVGDNTKIVDCLESVFGTDVTISGTWDVPFARPEWFSNSDQALNITSAFSLSKVVKLVEGKKYECSTTITLYNGQSLILSDSALRWSYDLASRDNCTIINSTAAPAIHMYCGSNIKGGQINSPANDGQNALLIDYTPSGNGNPNGTFIEFVQFKNTHLPQSSSNITTAAGSAVYFNSECYCVNILNCDFSYFKKGIETKSGVCVYILNIVARFNFCRHIFDILSQKLKCDFILQAGNVTQNLSDLADPVIDLHASTGFIDGAIFDLNRGTYVFSNILNCDTKIPLVTSDIPMVIGDRLTSHLIQFSTTAKNINRNVYWSPVFGDYYSGLGMFRPNIENNLFRYMKKDVDYSVTYSNGASQVTNPAGMFKEGDYSDWRFMFNVSSDTDYAEINFPEFKLYQYDTERVQTFGIADFACVFENTSSTFANNRKPKAVIVTITNANNVSQKFMIYSQTLTLAQAKTIYASEIDANTICLSESNMSEYSISPLPAFGAFRNIFVQVKSINIKIYGSISSSNRVCMVGLYATLAERSPVNFLAGNNRWRGDNRFAGKVFMEGNVVSSRPTGVPAGYQIFDKNLGRPIWYNGSGWVDAAGNAV